MTNLTGEELVKFISLSLVFSVLITIPLWMARPEKEKKDKDQSP